MNHKPLDNIVVGLQYLYADLGKMTAESNFAFAERIWRQDKPEKDCGPGQGNACFDVEANRSARAKLRANLHTIRLGVQVLF